MNIILKVTKGKNKDLRLTAKIEVLEERTFSQHQPLNIFNLHDIMRNWEAEIYLKKLPIDTNINCLSNKIRINFGNLDSKEYTNELIFSVIPGDVSYLEDFLICFLNEIRRIYKVHNINQQHCNNSIVYYK